MTDQHILTPVQIERKMLDLYRANEEAHNDLRLAEIDLAEAERVNKLGRSRAYLETYRGEQKGWTEARRSAWADVQTEAEQIALAAATVKARNARSRVAEIKTAVDLVRSMGTSVRTALEG